MYDDLACIVVYNNYNNNRESLVVQQVVRDDRVMKINEWITINNTITSVFYRLDNRREKCIAYIYI